MMSDFDNFKKQIEKEIENYSVIKNNKKIRYFNIACAFDIETSSFYENDEKRAIMYEWTFEIENIIIYGRTWQEFYNLYNFLISVFELYEDRRLIIYVHNLSFEFQFLKNRFNWLNVFAIDNRKPIYAVTNDGVEFRCSYLLSGYSLAKLGENLQKYKVQKMVGDLDYKLIRNSKTELTEKELKYCFNDVQIVTCYIKECIEKDGNITQIPLTKTGYVRKFCRNSCLYEGSHRHNTNKFLKYHRLMKALTITKDEYSQLKRAFQGGFTHANAFYSDKLLYNVGSYDFTSSYPSVMIAEQYPMSKGKIVKVKTKKELNHYLKYYCCLFDVQFTNIESTSLFEHYLASSRCSKLEEYVEDNGRIVKASNLITTITELDYKIITKLYKWDNIKIGKFRIYQKAYLPTDFVKAILKLYSDKTTLKDVQGKESEYLNSKEMLNSCYGMAVTDICRNEIKFENGKWIEELSDIEKSLKHYNNSKKRFLFYAWGVWVTAYARRNLFKGIMEFGNDYVYSDTDSVKGLNIDNHKEFIEKYNKNIVKKLEKALKWHNLPLESISPKTITGKIKTLGVWDFEGVYSRFKTLGAKRYMVEKDNKISMTVSGVNKKFAVPYLVKKYGDKIFDNFTNELYIPKKTPQNMKIFDSNGLKIENPTGKNTHTYLDFSQQGIIKDYQGNIDEYDEFSSTHLEPTDFTLTLSNKYIDFLMGIREYSK